MQSLPVIIPISVDTVKFSILHFFDPRCHFCFELFCSNQSVMIDVSVPSFLFSHRLVAVLGAVIISVRQPVQLPLNLFVAIFLLPCVLLWYREMGSPILIPPTKLWLVDCLWTMSTRSDTEIWNHASTLAVIVLSYATYILDLSTRHKET